MLARVPAAGEVGAQQRMLELALASFASRPVQQPVGIEGVVGAAALALAVNSTYRAWQTLQRVMTRARTSGRKSDLERELIPMLASKGLR